MKKLTNQEFIKRAQAVHGNKYDYSKVVYKNNYTKITIICKKHGTFIQKPNTHLNGSGCPNCCKLDIEDYFKRVNQFHGNKYDYSKVVLNKIADKIKIICPEHGVFEQFANNHLRSGCARCARISNTKDFILKAKKIHGEKFDYSNVDYKNNKTKIKIICPKHGGFDILPPNHLRSKNGCKICADESYIKDNIKFISEANIIHENKYDYSKTIYEGCIKKITIICHKHGEFKQTPNNHLNGSGCPNCKNSKGENKIITFFKKYNIPFLKEYKFKTCKNKRPLPFDFYLPDYNLLIEFDGLQHFKPIFGSKAFSDIKRNDDIKNTFCKNKNIKLLRIPYVDIDKINNILANIILNTF